jgi:hypothetical protein
MARVLSTGILKRCILAAIDIVDNICDSIAPGQHPSFTVAEGLPCGFWPCYCKGLQANSQDLYVVDADNRDTAMASS